MAEDKKDNQARIQMEERARQQALKAEMLERVGHQKLDEHRKALEDSAKEQEKYAKQVEHHTNSLSDLQDRITKHDKSLKDWDPSKLKSELKESVFGDKGAIAGFAKPLIDAMPDPIKLSAKILAGPLMRTLKERKARKLESQKDALEKKKDVAAKRAAGKKADDNQKKTHGLLGKVLQSSKGMLAGLMIFFKKWILPPLIKVLAFLAAFVAKVLIPIAVLGGLYLLFKDTVDKWVKAAWEGITKFFEDPIGEIKKMWTMVTDKFKNFAYGLEKPFADMIENMKESVKEVIRNFLPPRDSMMSKFIPDALYDAVEAGPPQPVHDESIGQDDPAFQKLGHKVRMTSDEFSKLSLEEQEKKQLEFKTKNLEEGNKTSAALLTQTKRELQQLEKSLADEKAKTVGASGGVGRGLTSEEMQKVSRIIVKDELGRVDVAASKSAQESAKQGLLAQKEGIYETVNLLQTQVDGKKRELEQLRGDHKENISELKTLNATISRTGEGSPPYLQTLVNLATDWFPKIAATVGLVTIVGPTGDVVGPTSASASTAGTTQSKTQPKVVKMSAPKAATGAGGESEMGDILSTIGKGEGSYSTVNLPQMGKFARQLQGGGISKETGKAAKGDTQFKHLGQHNIRNTALSPSKGGWWQQAGGKDITQMTVDEVIAAQDKGMMFAAGRYQVIPSTLKMAKKNMGLKGSEKFDKATQDRIGAWLVTGKAGGGVVGKFLRGEATLDEAATGMSKEWASISTEEGKMVSYYKGEHNKAHTSRESIKERLLKLKASQGGGQLTPMPSEAGLALHDRSIEGQAAARSGQSVSAPVTIVNNNSGGNVSHANISSNVIRNPRSSGNNTTVGQGSL